MAHPRADQPALPEDLIDVDAVIGAYYDLATRRTLDDWRNPLSDETLKVVHLANDPVNHVIREWVSPPPVVSPPSNARMGGLCDQAVPICPFDT